MKTCPKCEKELADEIKFCPACGAKTDEPPAPEPPLEVEKAPPETGKRNRKKKPKAEKSGAKGFLAGISEKLESFFMRLTQKTSAVVMVFSVVVLIILLLLIASGGEISVPKLVYSDVDAAINLTASVDEAGKIEDMEELRKAEYKFGERVGKVVEAVGFENPAEKRGQIMAVISKLPGEGQRKFTHGLENVAEVAKRDNPNQVVAYVDTFIELYVNEFKLSNGKKEKEKRNLIKKMAYCSVFLTLVLGLTAILTLMRIDTNIKELKESIEKKD